MENGEWRRRVVSGSEKRGRENYKQEAFVDAPRSRSSQRIDNLRCMSAGARSILPLSERPTKNARGGKTGKTARDTRYPRQEDVNKHHGISSCASSKLCLRCVGHDVHKRPAASSSFKACVHCLIFSAHKINRPISIKFNQHISKHRQ